MIHFFSHHWDRYSLREHRLAFNQEGSYAEKPDVQTGKENAEDAEATGKKKPDVIDVERFAEILKNAKEKVDESEGEFLKNQILDALKSEATIVKREAETLSSHITALARAENPDFRYPPELMTEAAIIDIAENAGLISNAEALKAVREAATANREASGITPETTAMMEQYENLYSTILRSRGPKKAAATKQYAALKKELRQQMGEEQFWEWRRGANWWTLPTGRTRDGETIHVTKDPTDSRFNIVSAKGVKGFIRGYSEEYRQELRENEEREQREALNVMMNFQGDRSGSFRNRMKNDMARRFPRAAARAKGIIERINTQMASKQVEDPNSPANVEKFIRNQRAWGIKYRHWLNEGYKNGELPPTPLSGRSWDRIINEHGKAEFYKRLSIAKRGGEGAAVTKAPEQEPAAKAPEKAEKAPPSEKEKAKEAPKSLETILSEPVAFDFVKTDLVDIADFLTELTGKDFFIRTGYADPYTLEVTIREKNLPLRDALKEMLDPLNLTFEKQGEVIVIREQEGKKAKTPRKSPPSEKERKPEPEPKKAPENTKKQPETKDKTPEPETTSEKIDLPPYALFAAAEKAGYRVHKTETEGTYRLTKHMEIFKERTNENKMRMTEALGEISYSGNVGILLETDGKNITRILPEALHDVEGINFSLENLSNLENEIINHIQSVKLQDPLKTLATIGEDYSFLSENVEGKEVFFSRRFIDNPVLESYCKDRSIGNWIRFKLEGKNITAAQFVEAIGGYGDTVADSSTLSSAVQTALQEIETQKPTISKQNLDEAYEKIITAMQQDLTKSEKNLVSNLEDLYNKSDFNVRYNRGSDTVRCSLRLDNILAEGNGDVMAYFADEDMFNVSLDLIVEAKGATENITNIRIEGDNEDAFLDVLLPEILQKTVVKLDVDTLNQIRDSVLTHLKGTETTDLQKKLGDIYEGAEKDGYLHFYKKEEGMKLGHDFSLRDFLPDQQSRYLLDQYLEDNNWIDFNEVYVIDGKLSISLDVEKDDDYTRAREDQLPKSIQEINAKGVPVSDYEGFRSFLKETAKGLAEEARERYGLKKPKTQAEKAPEAMTPSIEEKEITMEFHLSNPLEVFEYMQKQHGLDIELDTDAIKGAGVDLENKQVSLNATYPVRVQSALRIVTDQLGLSYTVDKDNKILITTRAKAGKVDTPNVPSTIEKSILQKLQNEKMTVEFAEANLSDVLEHFEEELQINTHLISGPGLTPETPTTIKREGATPEDILKAMLPEGAIYSVENDVLVVRPEAQKPSP